MGVAVSALVWSPVSLSLSGTGGLRIGLRERILGLKLHPGGVLRASSLRRATRLIPSRYRRLWMLAVFPGIVSEVELGGRGPTFGTPVYIT